MNNYEVIGVGKETNRKRKKVYRAETEDVAKALAEKDGTLVESINLLPPEPATDRQLSYAKDLGINIPNGPTKDQISYLISSKTETPASNDQINYALKLGVQFHEYDFKSKETIQNKINNLLGHDSARYNAEIAKWYVYSIARYLSNGNWSTPEKSNIETGIIEDAVKKLMADEKSFKSFQRQIEYEEPFAIVLFGQKTDKDGYFQEGASRNTAAYKLVSELLKENLEIQKKAPKPKQQRTRKPTTQAKKEESSNYTAVFGVIVVIAILCYLLF